MENETIALLPCLTQSAGVDLLDACKALPGEAEERNDHPHQYETALKNDGLMNPS
jgi:hypothetical protein